MTEPELVSWVNLTWLTEELFTNLHDRGDSAIEGRFVPGALVFAFAEARTRPDESRCWCEGLADRELIGRPVRELARARAETRPARPETCPREGRASGGQIARTRRAKAGLSRVPASAAPRAGRP